MTYQRRKQSEADIYHIIVRGSGKQLMFEDDEDRKMYLAGLSGALASLPAELYAWCLMGNHIHLLVHADIEIISYIMREVGRFYSQYFNKRHNRVGHLNQGRFRSIPIDSEEQLLVVARYIHQNPVKAGLSETCRYKWSSYLEYLGVSCPEERPAVATRALMDCFGSLEAFVQFHEQDETGSTMPSSSKLVYKISDEDALDLMHATLEDRSLTTLPLDNKQQRDEILASLKDAGIPIRQIARITGVGRNIVQTARHRKQ